MQCEMIFLKMSKGEPQLDPEGKPVQERCTGELRKFGSIANQYVCDTCQRLQFPEKKQAQTTLNMEASIK